MASERPVMPSRADGSEKKASDSTQRGPVESVTEYGRKAARNLRSRSGHEAKESPRPTPKQQSRPALSNPRTRSAHLRLTRIDPLSMMKMSFLLSIALGIVMVVAVTIIWSVLSAVGVWDNIDSAVQQVIGTESGDAFHVSDYIGTSRVIGFALIASVINVVLLTAIATLAAFIYNLAAALLGGVEMTWAEDR